VTAMFFLLANLGPAHAADLPIRDDPSPLEAERPKRSKTLLVILHTTEGGDESAQRLVRLRGLANYLVLRDGTVIRVIDPEREARHAGRSMWNGTEDLDEVSVGIEVVGYHNLPITPAQEGSVRELVAQLKATYALQDVAVLAHAAVAYGAPNQWHDRPHRGRKRCGMQFAGTELRARLGLASRPVQDPDVVAGRLVEADPELAAVLYGVPIARGQTAFHVVGDPYDDPETVYVFPGGASVRGDEVKSWSDIPAGTYVRVKHRDGPG
jgi:N-acetylmuramoyl-L-alanine amidase